MVHTSLLINGPKTMNDVLNTEIKLLLDQDVNQGPDLQLPVDQEQNEQEIIPTSTMLDNLRERYAQWMMFIVAMVTISGCTPKMQQLKKTEHHTSQTIQTPRPGPKLTAAVQPKEAQESQEKQQRIERIKNLIIKFQQIEKLPKTQRREFIQKTIIQSELFLLGIIEQEYAQSPYLSANDIDDKHELYTLEVDREKWLKEFKDFSQKIIEEIMDAPTRYKRGNKKPLRGRVVSKYLRQVVVGSDQQLNMAAQFPNKHFTEIIVPYMLAALFFKKKFPNSYTDSPNSSFKDLLKHFSDNGQTCREYAPNEQRPSLCKYLAIMGSDLIHRAIKMAHENGLISKVPQVGTLTSKTTTQAVEGISSFTGVGTPVEHVVVASPHNGNNIPKFYFEATTGEIRPWSLLVKEKQIKQGVKPRDIVAGMGGLITNDIASRIARPILQGENRTAMQENALLKRAMQYIKVSLGFDPQNHVTQTNTGVLLVASNKNTEAIPYFQRALQINPYDFGAASLGNATAHFNIQKFPEVLQILQGMIHLVDQQHHGKIPHGNTGAAYIKGYHLLAETQLVTGKKRAAIRTSRKIMGKTPQNGYSHYLYGRSLVESSRRYCSRGLRHIKRGDSLTHNKDRSIRLGLARAYKRCGRYTQAQKLFTSLGREDLVVEESTRNYMKQKKWDAALRGWLTLAAANPNEYVYLYYIAVCFRNLKNYQQAIEYAQKAGQLKNDPELNKIIQFSYQAWTTQLYNRAVKIFNDNKNKGNNPIALQSIKDLFSRSQMLLNNAQNNARINLLKKNWPKLLKDSKQEFGAS